MQHISRISFFSLFVFILTGCATLLVGNKRPVYVSSEPSNTPLYINGEYMGETPIIINQKANPGKTYYSIRMSDEDQDKHNFILDKKLRPISLVGLPLVVPFAADLVTGASHLHEANSYFHNFSGESHSSWAFKMLINKDSIDIDPLSVFISPKTKFGLTASNPSTNEDYEFAIGKSITGVYEKDQKNYTISYQRQFASKGETELVSAKNVAYFNTFTYTLPGLQKLLYKDAMLGVSLYQLKVNDIDRLEQGQSNSKKDLKDSDLDIILPQLNQFWPRFTGVGNQQILFQVFRTNQSSSMLSELPEDMQRNKYYYSFVLFDGTKAVEISAQELKDNFSFFSENPYLKSIVDNAKDGNEVQRKLSSNPIYLTNIIGWEWANQSGESFFEFYDPKAKKEEEKQQEKDEKSEPKPNTTSEPKVLADNDDAKKENKKNLNRYSNTVNSLKPAEEEEDVSYKYYGSEAPWYLQGQLKPEYRKSASDLGLEEEELYDPTPKKIDSTRWLKDQKFELIAPELEEYKPGFDPGYINPDDPRKKPSETTDTPWYLKTPEKKKTKPAPTGKTNE